MSEVAEPGRILRSHVPKNPNLTLEDQLLLALTVQKGLRKSTYKRIEEIKGILKKKEPDVDDLEDALAVLIQKEEELSSIDDRVEALTEDPNELLQTTEEASEIRDQLTALKSKATRTINKARGPGSSSASTYGGSTVLNTDTAAELASRLAENSHRTEVKLPALTISSFNGDVTKWSNFWGRFAATVDKNPRLSQVEKFIYLGSYLEGEAFKTIEGIVHSEDAYGQAVELLKNRFDKADLAIHFHRAKLAEIQPVSNSNDLKALRNLLNTYEINMRSLKALKVDENLEAIYACPNLLRCIPNDLRTLFCSTHKKKEGNWVASAVIEFVKNQIESRELSEMYGGGTSSKCGKEHNYSQEKSDSYEKRNKKYRDEKKQSTAMLAIGSRNSGENTYCVFCATSDHKSINCRNYDLEQKRQIMKDSGRCFICTRLNHSVGSCRSRFKNCLKCHKNHNFAVCEFNEVNKKPTQNSLENRETITETKVCASSVSQVGGGASVVLLQTALATTKNPSKTQNCEIARCLFDGGSQQSFIKESLSRKLNLPIVGEQALELHSFGNKNPVTQKCKRVKVILENREFPEKSVEITLTEIPFLCDAVTSIKNSEIKQVMIEKGLQLADDSQSWKNHSSEIEILIGGDLYWLICTTNLNRLSPTVVAMETILGWALHGPISGQLNALNTGIMMFAGVKQVDKALRNFFELEGLGINSQEISENHDEQTIGNLFNDIEFKEGRYEVKFPWRVSRDKLPNNLPQATKRFQGLIKKFEKDPMYFHDYKKVIEDQIENKIVEVVPKNEVENIQPGIYYMPHQGVVRKDASTTKLRVVLDGSSHGFNCPSLNECLDQGPNLNPDLLKLLLRFRKYEIAIVADIKQAYLQVGISEADRDAVRFLWVKENNGVIEQNDYVVLRMARVPFGVTSSPFLLAGTIKHHLQQNPQADKKTVEKLNRDLYVDDFTTGVENVREGFKITVEAAKLMKTAGMEFRKWGTNSEKLRQLWRDHDKKGDENVFEMRDHETESKVLGKSWDPKTDTFSYDLKNLMEFANKTEKTKRHVLSLVSQIFDPIGLLGPFTIRAKILFQKIWEAKVDWDGKLPFEIEREFQTWILELPHLHKIKVDRYYFSKATDKVEMIELHCFCDASIKAYATAIYVRYQTQTKQIGSNLVTAKTRVAPLKLGLSKRSKKSSVFEIITEKTTKAPEELTLPKLELMGCLLAARLANCIKNTFEPIHKIYYWTDSTVALSWIKGDPKLWKPFVSNRVRDIQGLSDINSWRHCPGANNPADLPTRGMGAENLVNSEFWWEGPKWLSEPKENWPNHPQPNAKLEVVENEKRKITLAVSVKEKQIVKVQEIIDITKHNYIGKTLRITSYVLRFIEMVKEKIKITGPITAEELEKAEIIWVKSIQGKIYEKELDELKTGELSKTSKLLTLNPVINDAGLLCVGGRLEESSLTYYEKHPILLNKNENLTHLLMKRSHEKSKHGGINDTIVQMRERYWIPAGRQLARSVVKSCLICKKLTVKPLDTPTAALPKDRVDETPAFSKIGIDFGGPLLIKSGKNTEKAYFCIITCAVTRAVHLELVPSLSTDNFLLAFTRMFCRRGTPQIIYSDNAKTFKAADQHLQRIWKNIDQSKFQEFFAKEGIKWKYIVERAAWYGGFWEVLVKSTKLALKKNLGNAFLNYVEMETALIAAEAMINSRPITYCYNDLNEPTPLSPAEFLIGRRVTSLPPLENERENENTNVPATRLALIKRLQHRENVLDKLWKRFHHEYVMELRTAHYGKNPKNKNEIKKGDVVIIIDDQRPRHMWKLGVVLEIIEGRDGKIRSCLLKTTNGTTIRRSVQHVCNLEIQV